MSWRSREVLVTGAAGFIGSHLVEALVDAGAKVRAFVHYNALGNWGWLDRSRVIDSVEVVAGDICDRDSVQLAAEGAEVVFHLAALVGIPYSYAAPSSYVKTNVEGTLCVLGAALRAGVARMVHTSTSEVYGTARYVPIDEDHQLRGQSPYAASKIAADKLAESYFHSFGLPIVSVRPFNTYGPRQSARAVVPSIITQCLVGDTVRLGNLSPTRDLIFVHDTVRGFLAAGCQSGIEGETFNLGSGREIAMGELAETVVRLIGRDVSIVEDKQRVRPEGSEVERLVADASRARERLAWRPETSLEAGLEQTIAWFHENLNRYRPELYGV